MRPIRTTHGDAGYARRTGCKCEPCRRGVSVYTKRLSYDKARGVSRRASVDPIKKHINALLDQGVAMHQIWNAAGVAPTVLRNIMGENGEPAKFALVPTALKLLNVTYEDAMQHTMMVPPDGIRRRLQALEWVGHPKSRIAQELGVSESMVHEYPTRMVTRSTTVEAVHQAYVTLRDIPGTSERAKWGARRRGWQPPWAWDDDTIDDPDQKPGQVRCLVEVCGRPAKAANVCPYHHRVLTERNALGPRRYTDVVKSLNHVSTSAARKQEVRDMLKVGRSDADIAERLDISKSYVQKIRTGKR